MRLLRSFVAAHILLSSLACSSDATAPHGEAASFRVQLSATSLIKSTTGSATAIAVDSAGKEFSLDVAQWSSSDQAVATIDTRGKITALAAGTTQISAHVGDASASADLVITEPFSHDVFSSYASTSALRSSTLYNQVESRLSLMSLDPALTYNGHPTARVEMPAHSSALGGLAIDMPSGGLANFWFRAKLRFSPGFTTAGTITSSANSLKLIAWGWVGHDKRGTVEITNTTEYQVWWDDGATSAWTSGGEVKSEWADDQWYDYIVHYEKTGSSSSKTQFWLTRDGQRPQLRGTVIGSGASYEASLVSFPHYFNQDRVAAENIWIGQWEIVDGSRFPDPFRLTSP